MTRTLIVFGAGSGIGNNVAVKFASKGINHIILLSRNTERLQNEDAPFVSKGNSSVKLDTLRIDLADLTSISGVLKELDSLNEGENVEVIFFNAARIKPGEVLGVDVEEIDEDFKTTNLSLYVISQHYIPKPQALARSNTSLKPALLVTSSHLPWDPIPQLLSLSLIKAAQKNMVDSFRRYFGDSGIHFGLIHVEGTVAPENKVLNPGTIAKKTVSFWESGKGECINIREERWIVDDRRFEYYVTQSNQMFSRVCCSVTARIENCVLRKLRPFSQPFVLLNSSIYTSYLQITYPIHFHAFQLERILMCQTAVIA